MIAQDLETFGITIGRVLQDYGFKKELENRLLDEELPGYTALFSRNVFFISYCVLKSDKTLYINVQVYDNKKIAASIDKSGEMNTREKWQGFLDFITQDLVNVIQEFSGKEVQRKHL